jgi:hypothetical protein
MISNEHAIAAGVFVDPQEKYHDRTSLEDVMRALNTMADEIAVIRQESATVRTWASEIRDRLIPVIARAETVRPIEIVSLFMSEIRKGWKK